jgi:glycosyltransferase involved in cell wall biosynthesis
MHIGIDASRVATTTRTGTEQYSVALLGALAALDRRSRYTLYLNEMPHSLPPLGPNFTLRSLPQRRLWTHARLSAELFAHPPDVLFVPAHVLPCPGALRPGLRSVVTLHDLGYEYFPAAHPRAQRLYLRLSTRWSARVAQRVIAVSEATKRDLVRFTRIDAAKVTVVYHGVDRHFAPATLAQIAPVAARYGVDGPYFLYVGTIQPRKNLERLLRAYARAAKGQAHFPQLLIAGRVGWLSEGIVALAQQLGVAGRVRLLGYVPDEHVPALLGGALAFTYVSLHEGFGMPVLEAMACGTPVLTSNTSALPEVAGDAALLVDPLNETAIAEGLLRLADDPVLRADVRARGLLHAASWTWRRCAEETLGVLQAAAQPLL